MEATMKHTPIKAGPVIQRNGKALFWTDETKPGKWQRRLDEDRDGIFPSDTANFIAHACNCYDDLLEALRLVDRWLYQDNFDAMPVSLQAVANIVEATIAKAEGNA